MTITDTTDHAPQIQILRVMKTRRRYRPDNGSTLDRAFAHGFVDGYAVACRANRGWSCMCPDVECGHPEAFAAVLHPEILAELEGESA